MPYDACDAMVGMSSDHLRVYQGRWEMEIMAFAVQLTTSLYTKQIKKRYPLEANVQYDHDNNDGNNYYDPNSIGISPIINTGCTIPTVNI